MARPLNFYFYNSGSEVYIELITGEGGVASFLTRRVKIFETRKMVGGFQALILSVHLIKFLLSVRIPEINNYCHN
jgi:energy-converting hydrogenase Eha subunit H